MTSTVHRGLPDVRPTGCDLATWERYLTMPDLPEHLLSWLVDQAAGWPDYEFADRAHLYSSLLDSVLPLTEDHLVRLCGGEGPPSGDLTGKLLRHPACGVRAIVELTAVACSVHGGAATAPQWLPSRHRRHLDEVFAGVFDAVRADPSERVRAIVGVAARGLAAWHPDWESVKGYARGHGQARANLRAAMVALDECGDPHAWRLLLHRLDSGAVPCRAEVDAVLGACLRTS